MMKKIYFNILFILVSVCSYAQTDTKAQADSAYINNDFAGAVNLYEQILANEGESADIYYNLGNSYYKMDNIAKAIARNREDSAQLLYNNLFISLLCRALVTRICLTRCQQQQIREVANKAHNYRHKEVSQVWRTAFHKCRIKNEKLKISLVSRLSSFVSSLLLVPRSVEAVVVCNALDDILTLLWSHLLHLLCGYTCIDRVWLQLRV